MTEDDNSNNPFSPAFKENFKDFQDGQSINSKLIVEVDENLTTSGIEEGKEIDIAEEVKEVQVNLVTQTSFSPEKQNISSLPELQL